MGRGQVAGYDLAVVHDQEVEVVHDLEEEEQLGCMTVLEQEPGSRKHSENNSKTSCYWVLQEEGGLNFYLNIERTSI
jgi:hypothetical protein